MWIGSTWRSHAQSEQQQQKLCVCTLLVQVMDTYFLAVQFGSVWSDCVNHHYYSFYMVESMALKAVGFGQSHNLPETCGWAKSTLQYLWAAVIEWTGKTPTKISGLTWCEDLFSWIIQNILQHCFRSFLQNGAANSCIFIHWSLTLSLKSNVFYVFTFENRKYVIHKPYNKYWIKTVNLWINDFELTSNVKQCLKW